MQANEPRKLRRTSNACIACRQSKIKCSGDDPCANCRRRFVHCRFAEAGRRFSGVNRGSFSFIAHTGTGGRRQQQLSPRFALPEPTPSGEAAQEPAGSAHGEIAQNIWTSPFTLPSTVIVESNSHRRKWIWLAPSSMWSFSARLTIMIDQKLNLGRSPYAAPTLDDDETYPVRWKPGSAVDDTLDTSDLPSSEEARYLFNTVKFHLGQIYPLLDEKSFVAGMERFYYQKNSFNNADQPQLWYLQYFLVLAFGRAFLSRSKVPGEPPGWKYFSRAMSLMPDYGTLAKDVLVAIEVLALSALYLYSIDHRESAQVFISQAIRAAQLEGLHTQLPEASLGVETLTRCRNLWWTLYVMDRHISSSLGLPMTVQDSDITTLLDMPASTLHTNPILNLQVRISRVHSFILNTIYKSERTQLTLFLESTKSILHALAGHAREIEEIIHVNLETSVERMPRGTRHITLLYHQCVIMATRPLLLSVLIELLDKLNQGQEAWRSLLHMTKTLISTGIKSASKTIQILSDEDSISAFLIFDLEFLYGAAIHLMMASAVFPDIAQAQLYDHNAVHALFDEHKIKGNQLAQVRKAQLAHLELSFRELAAKVEQQGLQTPSLADPARALRIEPMVIPTIGQRDSVESDQESLQRRHSPLSGQGPAGDASMHAPTPSSLTTSTMTTLIGSGSIEPSGPGSIQSSNTEFLETIGISSDEFFRIVDQMAYSDATTIGIFDP